MMTESVKVPAWLVGQGEKVSMEGEARQSRGPFRFWLNKNSGTNIIFLSDGSDVPCIWEHQVCLRKAGKDDWNNYFTCLGPVVCPLCAFSDEFDKFYKQKVQLFTILDLTPYHNKRLNKQVLYSKKVLTAKKATSEILMRKYTIRLDQNQKLRGAQFAVHRGSDAKSANVGSDFEFIKMVDLSKFLPEDITVMDVAVLEPNRDVMIKVAERLQVASRVGEQQSYHSEAGVSTDDVVDHATTQIQYGDESEGTLPQGNSVAG